MNEQAIYLQMLKYQVTDALGPAVGASAELREKQMHGLIDRLAYTLSVDLQAHRISSETITRSQEVVKHFEAVDGPFQRWKQRHAKSWWLGWFVRWRPVRMITESFRRNVVLTVDVQDYATFPQSGYVAPSDALGPPVFKRVTTGDIRQLRNY